MSSHQIAFELNGQRRTASVPAHRLLLDFLREDMDQPGTKEGCGIGVCGACTVLVDGQPLSSCLLFAVSVDGASVRTVEGLAEADGSLTPLQDAFIRCGGFQCGICTSGQLMSATALLAENPQPTEHAAREWMMGNLCRCTGYYQITDAILQAAAEARSDP